MKNVTLLVVSLMVLVAQSDTVIVDGVKWTYTVSGGEAHVTGCDQTTGQVIIPKDVNGFPVVSIGDWMFADRTGITRFVVPEGVREFKGRAFCNCHSSINIPSTVSKIGTDAIGGVTIRSWRVKGDVSIDIIFFDYTLQEVCFTGPIPTMFANLQTCSYSGRYCCRREYAGEAAKVLKGKLSFGGYIGNELSVEIMSTNMREDDPSILDVVYRVTSEQPTVKIRALAFQDGDRNLAKLVRPTDFIEGTSANVGDAIAANVEHKLSWFVPTDWNVDLAKVRFEVLALDGDLLPLELVTIPKMSDHDAMVISRNAMSEQLVFDALLWLYADKDPNLSLTGGALKSGTTQLANGTGISATAAITYVYSKMGFSVLSGVELGYANGITRLGLSPSGVRQYAWRMVEE